MKRKNKAKDKTGLKRKMSSTSSRLSNMASSTFTHSSKSESTTASKNSDSSVSKPLYASSKAQCDLCKLSYSSEKELTEHLVSLMHHTKMEDKETNPSHRCLLCKEEFSCMTDYREHIGNSQHKKNLNKLRGIEEKEPQEKKKKEGRKGNWQASKKWLKNNHHQGKWVYHGGQDGRQGMVDNTSSSWSANNYYPKDSADVGHHRGGYRNGPYSNPDEENNGLGNYYAHPGKPNYGNRPGSGYNNGNTVYQYNEDDGPRWGSGAVSFNARGYTSYPGGRFGQNSQVDFTEDWLDYNCDDRWLQQRENYLASMDKDYNRHNSTDPHGYQHKEGNGFCEQQKDHRYSSSYENNSWKRSKHPSDSSVKDRKRHREEDGPASLSKTLKPFRIGPGTANGEHGRECVQSNLSYDEGNSVKQSQKEQPDREYYSHSTDPDKDIHSKTSFNYKTFKQPQSQQPSQDSPSNLAAGHNDTARINSSLDNTSDNLLERAERLCKELREKRESSFSWGSKLATKNQQSLTEKMSALAKKQQSYYKGHIKNSAPNKPQDEQLSGSEKLSESTKSSGSLKSSVSAKISGNVKPSTALQETSVTPEAVNSQPVVKSHVRLRSLEDIRKSIERSVIEERDGTTQGKSRLTNTCKGVLGTRTENQENPNSCLEQQRKKRVSGEEERESHSSFTGESVGTHRRPSSKQLLSKDSLLKMVNSPTSRTERLQLARIKMLQSSGDGKSNPPAATRMNVNLEGLYDEHETLNTHLDLGPGGDTPVIKLEDLSENIRNQIMSIIDSDIARTDSLMDDNPLSTLEAIPNNKEERERKSSVGKTKKRTTSCPMPGEKSTLNPTEDDMALGDSADVRDNVRNKPEMEMRRHKSLGEEKRLNLLKTHNDGGTVDRQERPGMDKSSSLREGADCNTSLTLNSNNVMERFPTILGGLSSPREEHTDGNNGGNNSGNNTPQLDPVSSLSFPSTTPPFDALQQSSSRSSFPASSQRQTQPAGGSTVSVLSLPSAGSRSPGLPVPTGIGTDSKSQGKKLDDDDQSSITSSQVNDGDSSQIMSELLLLSEREEEVKQEMTTMELRLTRLHRLLEQAVNQINKCTERRNELHDEEKSLSSRRINLLRAESSKQGSKASSTETHNTSLGSISSHDLQRLTAMVMSNQPRRPSESCEKTPDSTEENVPGSLDPKSSISKSEWLAKFSAFLPSTNPCTLSPAISNSNETISFSCPNISTASSHAADPTNPTPTVYARGGPLKDFIPASDLARSPQQSSSKYLTTLKDGNNSNISFLQSPSLVRTIRLSEMESLSNLPSNPSSALVSSGLIKIGKDLSSCNHSKPSAIDQDDQTLLEKRTISLQIDHHQDMSIPTETRLSGKSNYERMQMEPTRDIGVGVIRPPSSKASFPLVMSPRNEDSDIGSVTSLASGSSLGEKISHYCRQTSGASLDVPGRHNLSVILSGPSDSNDVRGQDDQDQDSNNDSVALETKKTLYGSLSKEVVKSAEALHLIERNSDGLAGSLSSKVNASKEAKKKKRKTKHERDTGVTSRRRRYIISSSSEGEGAAKEQPLPADGLSAIDAKERRPLEVTSEDSSSDVIEIRPVSSQQTNNNNGSNVKVPLGDVTIAECDSSTNLGIVDSEGINAQSIKLKQMKESFIRTFGRSPKYKGSQSHGESVIEIDDVCNDENERTKAKATKIITAIISDSHTKDVVNLCSDSDMEDHKSGGERTVTSLCLDERSSSQANDSKFSGTFGPVCYFSVLNNQLYVGYQKFGFRVYDLALGKSIKGKEFFLNLKCMEAHESNKQVTVYVGHDCSVCSLQDETDSCTDVDLGTEVACLHMLEKNLHVGLDTGEICVLNNKLAKVNRYICADSPIYSMSSGQEGSTRLLCVSSLDSTITVMDAERCLPLRILLGHTKTAFSLQVYGRFVYSASGDSTVMIHNVHTASVEQIHRDNKGIVNCVFYSNGYLFTGGLDRLVRCYSAKSHKLIQHYYGADKGAIKSIYVHGKMLITGNTSGSVDVITIDLKAKNVCPKKGCGLNFGLSSHLSWHLRTDH